MFGCLILITLSLSLSRAFARYASHWTGTVVVSGAGISFAMSRPVANRITSQDLKFDWAVSCASWAKVAHQCVILHVNEEASWLWVFWAAVVAVTVAASLRSMQWRRRYPWSTWSACLRNLSWIFYHLGLSCQRKQSSCLTSRSWKICGRWRQSHQSTYTQSNHHTLR